MSMPALSIIVPIYNASLFLCRCLDSLRNQSYGDFEVLMIDDGCTDGSGKLCDDYCSIDKRFLVYHIENHGVSYARNLGVEKSNAELITFVDSDDSVTSDYCEVILREIGDNDLLVFQTEKRSITGNQTIIQRVGSFTGQSEVEEGLSSLHSKHDQFGWPWNKVYRRRIIVDCGILFPIGVNWYEDEVFALRYAKNVTKMKIIPDVIHNYNVSEYGLTHTALSSNGVSVAADMIKDEMSWIKDKDFSQGFILQIFRFYNRAAVLDTSVPVKMKLFKKARSYYHQNKECIQLGGRFDRLMYSMPYFVGVVSFLLFGREL